jgi:hypothetical protein
MKGRRTVMVRKSIDVAPVRGLAGRAQGHEELATGVNFLTV